MIFLWAIGMLMGTLTTSFFLTKIFGKTKGSPEIYKLLLKTNPFELVFLLILLSGIEEVIFRYFFVGVLSSVFGMPWVFILLGAFLFAAAHRSNVKTGNRNKVFFIHMPCAILYGILFLSHGLLFVWAIHFIYNLIAISLSRLYYGLYPEKIKEAFAV